ncbi:hypothetical protein I4F81_004166 [Pyropia yezoensis]|uniref:Uncharacterized protein n=1 Tax=Pyropia yezoensis TaxID=2788 RepID=A0ACC3BVE3_PYRYE|nr:hypothetical protein I4F81_004166 [Neopyropia yezoensis]
MADSKVATVGGGAAPPAPGGGGGGGAAGAGAAAAGMTTDAQKAVIERYQNLRAVVANLGQAVQEADGDRAEHDLVLRQLAPLPPSRRCWHQVGSVLSTRTVGEVVPVLTAERTRLEGVMRESANRLAEAEAALAELTRTYNIRERGQGA